MPARSSTTAARQPDLQSTVGLERLERLGTGSSRTFSPSPSAGASAPDGRVVRIKEPDRSPAGIQSLFGSD